MIEDERTRGERLRITHAIANIRGLLAGLEATVVMPAVPVSESAQAVADAAIRLVGHAGRLDAYQLAEVDARKALLAPIDRGTIRQSIQTPTVPALVRSMPYVGPDACPNGGFHDPAAPTDQPPFCRKCRRRI